ncbi:MAG: hypothetical protein C4536_11110 [Actinobacteria bacterium]|jgi:hypothetical protein|nr:MAG: hypothetical protein C4536_11110 [Actinomycetota bacterium]
MVQVDVFWSYGIGSSFALAAFRQLRKLKAENELRKWKLGWGKSPGLPEVIEDAQGMEVIPAGSGAQGDLDFQRIVKQLRANGFKPDKASLKDLRGLQRAVKAWFEANSDAFNNEYFLKNLLFLSLLFVPSGAVLLWSNPSWETMQVGRYETIPQWLVGIFSTTNVTQGLLGFYLTYKALLQGKYYQASMHTLLSYLGFFFILVNGWDNKGYQRFFSKNRASFDDWRWSNVIPWAFSDAAMILLTYGAAFLPLMYYWIIDWFLKGQDMEKGIEEPRELPDRMPEAMKKLGEVNTAIFGGALGGAVLSTVLVRRFGWGPGMAIWAALMGLNLSKVGLGPALCKRIMGVESLQDLPVEEVVARAIEAEKAPAGVS